MKEIDWDALDEVRHGNHAWRSAFPSLSNVYVPGEGDNPLVMIIGDAPGAQEEIKRRPFVSAAGNVLRQLMDSAGLWATDSSCDPSRPANCWLTTVVKFRPPRNRRPTSKEIQAARPWLRAEWVAIGKPRLIIPVGSVALEAVNGKRGSFLQSTMQTRINRDGVSMVIYPMLHPSFGLHNPALQPLLEQDWIDLGKFLQTYTALDDLAVKFSHAED